MVPVQVSCITSFLALKFMYQVRTIKVLENIRNYFAHIQTSSTNYIQEMSVSKVETRLST